MAAIPHIKPGDIIHIRMKSGIEELGALEKLIEFPTNIQINMRPIVRNKLTGKILLRPESIGFVGVKSSFEKIESVAADFGSWKKARRLKSSISSQKVEDLTNSPPPVETDEIIQKPTCIRRLVSAVKYRILHVFGYNKS